MSLNENNEPVKKKRGRKKKSELEAMKNNTEIENIVVEKPPPKKRGRKPKGGKIIENKVKVIHDYNEQNSVILHLKCSLNDIEENNDTMLDNKLLDNEKKNLMYCDINNDQNGLFNNTMTNINFSESDTDSENNKNTNVNIIDEYIDDNISMKNIWKKISKLKTIFHKNNVYDKNSACFWCSYDFDNPTIYIPKCKLKEKYDVYGCFCSPQCAVSHLMNENIDSSVKFERYQYINNIYGKVYNFDQNIKPAPSPYYLLEKYYGTLNIQEYRKLLNNEQLLMVVEKPLTHVFPELYEENNNFLLNKKIIPNNNYKIKTNHDKDDNKENNSFKKMFLKT